MIQIYTGEGKGKTTAAIGLAVRAAGHGLGVFVGQFLKGRSTGEIAALSRMPEITIEQFGGEEFVLPGKVSEADRQRARAGITRMKGVAESGQFAILVLDEINVALSLGVLADGPVRELLEGLPETVEVVCTGRGAPEWLLERADLVTEMKSLRHYSDRGLAARRGMEY